MKKKKINDGICENIVCVYIKYIYMKQIFIQTEILTNVLYL